jgi:hypothetical protein
MAGAADPPGYGWLASPDIRPGSWMSENGSCFAVLRGMAVSEVVLRAGLDDSRELDLTGVEHAAEQFSDCGIAVLSADAEWTALYEAIG